MTEQTHDPAPAPRDWQASSQPNGRNGQFNVYITDANGRKIAAVWGKPGEKEATCRMIVAAPDLLDVALRISTDLGVGENSATILARHTIALNEAIRKAIGVAPGDVDGAADVAAPLAPLVDSAATAMARG